MRQSYWCGFFKIIGKQYSLEKLGQQLHSNINSILKIKIGSRKILFGIFSLVLIKFRSMLL